MKRLLLALFVLAAYSSLHAQMTVTTDRFDFGSPYRYAFSIPMEYSYDQSPKLTIYDEQTRQLKIYDENLNLDKTVDLSMNRTFDYQLSYIKMTRTIKDVILSGVEEKSLNQTYDQFIHLEMMMDPNVTKESCPIVVQNGDSIIQFSSTYGNPELRYFAYDYYGTKYPYYTFKIKNGIVYSCRMKYDVVYTDWTLGETETKDYHKDLDLIRLCNINLNNDVGSRPEYYFYVSQTLFNDDAAYEYIIPKYTLAKKGNTSGTPTEATTSPSYESEDIELEKDSLITDKSSLALSGFQIISSEGNVVKDIDFDDGFTGRIDPDECHILTIGSNMYLVFDGDNANNESSSIFYKFDKNTTDIKTAKIMSGTMTIRHTAGNHSSTININLSDGNENGSDIDIISANGSLMKKITMPTRQKTARVLFSGPAGVYCVSRVQKGSVRETKKIILK